MAKGMLFGVSNIAKKVKKAYFGVGNSAKKVKKIYYGDENGRARLAWSGEGGTLVFSGQFNTKYYLDGTLHESNKYPNASSIYIAGMAWDGNRFIAGTYNGLNQYLYSYDAINWTQTGSKPDTTRNSGALAFFKGKYISSVWQTIDSSTSARHFLSYDFVNWTEFRLSTVSHYFFRFATNGNIIIGLAYNTFYNVRAWYSYDGIMWNMVGIGEYGYTDLIYYKGKFIIVAYNATLFTSVDGIKWTTIDTYIKVPSEYQNQVRLVANKDYVAIAYSSYQYRSSDLVNWTSSKIPSTTNVLFCLQGINCVDNKVMLIGRFYDTTKISAFLTEDFVTFTSINIDSNVGLSTSNYGPQNPILVQNVENGYPSFND